MRDRTPNRSRRLLGAAVVATALALAVLLATGAGADDTNLVRENTAKPFVFFLMDSSASMNLELGTGLPLPLDGDDPHSRIFQTKRALFEVMVDEEDIAFGFAHFNQDRLRAWSKHWLYRAPQAVDWTGTADGLLWPTPADLQVFGRKLTTIVLDNNGNASLGAPIPGGTCLAPLDFANAVDREKINRYSKLGEPEKEEEVTNLWVTFGGRKFLLRVRNNLRTDPGTGLPTPVGADTLLLTLGLVELPSGTPCPPDTDPLLTAADLADAGFGGIVTRAPNLQLVGEFLMHDKPTAKDQNLEATAGVLDWQDVFALNTNGAADSTGKIRPFSGKGIEGNYDQDFDPEKLVPVGFGDLDEYCVGSGVNEVCTLLTYPSFLHPNLPDKREMDRGDLLPWDWERDNKLAFLERLAPSIRLGQPPNFAIAPYLQDVSDSNLGAVQLAPGVRPPLVAFGDSPLARSVNDFRCWFNGTDNDQKCRNDGDRPWNEGWAAVAEGNDPLARCRRPFLIVISDGEDTTPPGTENASGDVGNLQAQAGVQTWVFNLGNTDNCKGNGELASIANQGKDAKSKIENCIDVSNGQQLADALRRVLGLIKEEARTFASAAVPSVQADEGDKLFLTQFTPENDLPIWEGHIFGLLKPLEADGVAPAEKPACSSDPNGSPRTNCLLWDAALEAKLQVNPGSPLGSGPNQRRVYYARDLRDDGSLTRSGGWPATRRFFAPDPATSAGDPPSVIETDLWSGLGIPFLPGDQTSIDGARAATAAAVAGTYAMKSRTTETGDVIEYILGEPFHSNPLVVGVPSNTRFFADNTDGYRDFAREHQLRRRVLYVGINDGMLHAVDTGLFDTNRNGGEGSFTDGTGRELFGYIPREVLPVVETISRTTSPHRWSVDATVAVADAFLDVVYAGAPDPGGREWRTVLVGGLRRGGESYYALDVTQPDVYNGDGEPQPDNGWVPSCAGAQADGTPSGIPGACGPVAYPAPLWEFDDSVFLPDGTRVRLDEDLDTLPDLAQTWSVPNHGRMLVVENGAVVAKHVVVFGGGIDPEEPSRGQWIYIVDVETGKAIYKQRLDGAAPAEPAAVDTNQDGLLDRVYIGTVNGFMYRIDLFERLDDGSIRLPQIGAVAVTAGGQLTIQQRILVDPGDPGENDPADPWFPRPIFSTAGPISTLDPTIVSRPIFFRPSVIFVASLGEFALGFGTGDREDLWSISQNAEGRFFVFVDETDLVNPSLLPLDETDLQGISDTADATNDDFLIGRAPGSRGWYIVLQPQERLVTNPFALSGITFFSTFNPIVDTSGVDENGDPVCALEGTSRVFGVFTTNGNGLLTQDGSTPSRWINTDTLVTEAFVEGGQTQNPDNPDAPTQSALSEALQNVMNGLMKLFPPSCRFANYRIDVKTITATTEVVHVAPVPVCIIEKNWKEF